MLHGYSLYSALVRANPQLKSESWQLKPITGNRRHHWIELNRESSFSIRCDLSALEWLTVPDLLRIEKAYVEVGAMEGRSLQPCPNLCSPIVVIKQPLATGEEYSRDRFLVSLGRQLEARGIKETPEVGSEKRYIKVRERSVIGFSVRFEGLEELSSLRLQQYGLGGKQRMGCGGFWCD